MHHAHVHTTVIEEGRIENNYWRNLWDYRELFLVLAWRDVAVRYKQTIFGVAWAIIQPLLTMVVFTVIFGEVANLPSDGNAPYPLLVFAALLPWQLFTTTITQASNSVISNSTLISKVYFPRLIIPSASAVVALIDFAIGISLFAILLAIYGFLPNWHILFLPIFITLAIITALGPSLWLSSLNVKYRDFRYIVPFIMQLGLYVSPVGFSTSIIPDEWRFLYGLNPMSGVIDGFRWCLLGQEVQLHLPSLFLSVIISATLLWAGIRSFRKTERSFVDLL